MYEKIFVIKWSLIYWKNLECCFFLKAYWSYRLISYSCYWWFQAPCGPSAGNILLSQNSVVSKDVNSAEMKCYASNLSDIRISYLHSFSLDVTVSHHHFGSHKVPVFSQDKSNGGCLCPQRKHHYPSIIRRQSRAILDVLGLRAKLYLPVPVHTCPFICVHEWNQSIDLHRVRYTGMCLYIRSQPPTSAHWWEGTCPFPWWTRMVETFIDGIFH